MWLLEMGDYILVPSSIIDEELPANSDRCGGTLLNELQSGLLDNILIDEIRGRGLFIAIEFYDYIAHDMCYKLMKAGVLVKDTRGKIIRLAPPLVITKKQTKDLANRVIETLNSLV